MAFGKRPRGRFLSVTPWHVALARLCVGQARLWCVLGALALLAAGCGGGGGNGDGDGDGGEPTTAIITGRVVDAISGLGVQGATVSYGNQSDLSGPTGAFSLTVPAPSPAQQARITAPNYRNLGQYNGVTVRLSTEGISVPAAAAGQTIDVGTIQLYSNDAPPPPPTL